MGAPANNTKRCGIDFNGDYKKQVLNQLGLFPSTKSTHWKDLKASDQYEMEQAFDKLPDQKVKDAWAQLKKAKKV